MLQLLLSLVNPLATLSTAVVDLFKLRTQAATDVEKAKIDEQIKRLSDQRDVILAAQQFTFSRDIYWFLLLLGALGPTAYVLKYLLWDKVIGGFVGCSGISSLYCRTTFSTDAITDPNIWWIVLAVFGFLYLKTRR